MRVYLLILFFYACISSYGQEARMLSKGSMPNAIIDQHNQMNVVFGNGDSIMMMTSNNGIDFSQPVLVSVIPKLVAHAMRGPQVGLTNSGLLITISTTDGNMYSLKQDAQGKWSLPVRMNDEDTVAKEGFMSLAVDGDKAYAVWLDSRSNKGQQLFGALSTDGGMTWSRNINIYTSPDTTICECCKPNVVMKNGKVYAMFRNWVKGNRDMYLIQSNDSGKSFGEAVKIGNGSWKLNGCPMDGGAIVLDNNAEPEVLFRRESMLYTARPGSPEKELAEGRNGSIALVRGKTAYAFGQKGNVILLMPGGIKKDIGKGSLPVIINFKDQIFCVWENAKQVMFSRGG